MTSLHLPPLWPHLLLFFTWLTLAALASLPSLEDFRYTAVLALVTLSSLIYSHLTLTEEFGLDVPSDHTRGP